MFLCEHKRAVEDERPWEEKKDENHWTTFLVNCRNMFLHQNIHMEYSHALWENWLTLKELCTRVSSRSITTHFLFMSCCRTAGSRYFSDVWGWTGIEKWSDNKIRANKISTSHMANIFFHLLGTVNVCSLRPSLWPPWHTHTMVDGEWVTAAWLKPREEFYKWIFWQIPLPHIYTVSH